MGTNFYSVDREKLLREGWENLRDGRGHEFDPDIIHIGKSSFGWCFALRIYPAEGIVDLGSWARWLVAESRIILDEYGDPISFSDLYARITDRKRPAGPLLSQPPERDDEWYHKNFAVPGPMGLARHTLGSGCVSHGDGTYDLIEGEFS